MILRNVCHMWNNHTQVRLYITVWLYADKLPMVFYRSLYLSGKINIWLINCRTVDRLVVVRGHQHAGCYYIRLFSLSLLMTSSPDSWGLSTHVRMHLHFVENISFIYYSTCSVLRFSRLQTRTTFALFFVFIFLFTSPYIFVSFFFVKSIIHYKKNLLFF